MNDDVDLVRSRINIVDLVGQRVNLKRTGKNWKGLCPFHDDRNPSFDVSPNLGRYQCWSCGAKGDIFNWVMQTQNVDFAEALRILAEQAGITLQRQRREAPGKRELYEKAMNVAIAFFKLELAKSTSALGYCEQRGLDERTRSDFEIGFAPDHGEALAVKLQKEGCSLADCKSLFLVEKDASGGYFDRFRGRLMFPIRDERGALVAFGGRLLGDGIPKYINSGDTPLYSKRRVLYGLNLAKEAIAKSRRTVLVEGYLDVIACHGSGVGDAVASLGTALSEDHAKVLRRWSDEVVVLYDSDAAGQKAAERACEMLAAEGVRVSVALLPDGKDPDTLLRALGPEAVRQACDSGLTPLDYRIRRIKAEFKPSDPQFWNLLAGILSQAKDHLEVETHIVALLPQYPGLRDPEAAERALRKQIEAARPLKGSSRRPVPRQAVVSLGAPSIDRREEALFHAFLSEEHRALAWEAFADDALFVTDSAGELAQAILGSFNQGPPGGPASEWLGHVEPEVQRDLLAELGHVGPSILSEQTLRHAIAQLRSRQDYRSMLPLRTEAGSDDAKLRELNERLVRAKTEMPRLLGERKTQEPK